MTATNIKRLQQKHTACRYYLPRFSVRDAELLFGYHDGDKRVVELQTEPNSRALRRRRKGAFQGIVLKGGLLTHVCAAVLYLTDHKITPSIRELRLRVCVNHPDTFSWIVVKKNGVSAYIERRAHQDGLRLRFESGPTWQEYDLDAEQVAVLVDRLCEAAQWPVQDTT